MRGNRAREIEMTKTLQIILTEESQHLGISIVRNRTTETLSARSIYTVCGGLPR